MAKKTAAPAAPLELFAEMPRGGQICTALAFSPDRHYLAAAAGDRKVHVYDVATGKRLYEKSDHTGAVGALAFSPDSQRLASSGERKDGRRRAGGEVLIWNVKKGNVEREVAFIERDEDDVVAVAFSPSGEHLVCSILDFEDDASHLAIVDAQSGRIASAIPAPPYGCRFAFAPDGQTLAGAFDDRLVLWEFPSGKQRRVVKLKQADKAICFSPDGKLIAVADADKTVHLLSAATGKPQKTLQEKVPSTSESLQFSADGKRLATIGSTMHGDSKGEVRIWDLATAKVLIAFEGRTGVEPVGGFPGECAISADLQWFANAGRKTRLWRIK